VQGKKSQSWVRLLVLKGKKKGMVRQAYTVLLSSLNLVLDMNEFELLTMIRRKEREEEKYAIFISHEYIYL
jgi:hypothetical protein